MHHPRTALIAHLRGELSPAARERVSAHLAGCPDCAREYAAFEAIVGELAATVPMPPEPHWGRWHAEIRGKLGARRRRRVHRWVRPLPLALSAGLASVLIAFALLSGPERPPRDPAAVEETVLGGRLELLRQYSVVERLDLLENLELIRQLDGLAPQRDG